MESAKYIATEEKIHSNGILHSNSNGNGPDINENSSVLNGEEIDLMVRPGASLNIRNDLTTPVAETTSQIDVGSNSTEISTKELIPTVTSSSYNVTE